MSTTLDRQWCENIRSLADDDKVKFRERYQNQWQRIRAECEALPGWPKRDSIRVWRSPDQSPPTPLDRHPSTRAHGSRRH